MSRTRDLIIGATFVSVLAALGGGERFLTTQAMAQQKTAVQAPRFEVDPLWPKPLPNHWLLGSTIGVDIDAQDHVWIVHRSSATLDSNEKGAEANPPLAECCKGAPPVLEFDQAGNLLHSWGGPKSAPGLGDWPESNHGITIDGKGNVWVAGNGGNDGQVLKLTKEGKLIKQFGFGYANAGSNDTWAFRQPAKIFVDDAKNEAYISDGYGNHRVIVIDAETGAFKRLWGAYGNKPNDDNLGRYNPNAPPAQQFRNPVHCAMLAHDNLLYVCDRVNDRIQVFKKDGTFVKEFQVEPQTLQNGSVWDLVLSEDKAQRYIFVADGANMQVLTIDRQTGEKLGSFGRPGHMAGNFKWVHNMAIDSKGTIYTAEVGDGRRVQKFKRAN
jgi:DNA-binding beta-propeller fold protein YncE